MPTPKKPTNILKITGNPGKRPLNEDEPQPPEAVPDMPKNILSKEAAEEWRRIVPQLEACGLLTGIDRAALIVYCQCYGDFVKCERLIKRNGRIVKTPNGMLQTSPYITQRNQAAQLMHKYLTEFGLTPSSRSKVTINKKAKTKDPLKKYSKGNQ